MVLDEVLTALGRNVRYHIEIKGWEDWLPLRLLQTVDRFDLAAIVTITSFSMRPLVQVRSIADFVPLCFLLRDAEDALRSAEFRPELEGRDAASVHDYWIDVAAEAGFQQVGVRASDVFPRTIARATDRGLEVRGWGVRNEEDLDRLVRLGAVGATVDWPSIAIDRVRAMGFEVGGCEVAG
jgi:glycerophosphoryl diester phosphodiesterase